MEDSKRFRLAGEGGVEPVEASFPGEPISQTVPRSDAQRPSRPSSPAFAADAMRQLFESGEVSIARGDETRVITREPGDDEPLPPAVAPGPVGERNDEAPRLISHSSVPPGPRVDVTLWVVLALGLFAIAGWMVAYGL